MSKSHRARNIIIGTMVGIVIIGGLVVAINLQSVSDGKAALEETTVDETTLPARLPFKFVAGHIVVDAVLADGADAVALILDSGAPTILSDELAERYGGGAVGTVSTAAIGGTVIAADIVTIPEVRLGGATFTDVGSVKGFVEADNQLSCISSNGLIGASLMKKAVWQIDFDAKEVIIASSVAGLDHSESATALGFGSDSSSSPSPTLQLPAGDGVLRFLVDTGSDASLATNPADLAAIGVEMDPAAPATSVVISGVSGNFGARLLYAAVDLELGEQQLDGFPIASLESFSAGLGNLGTGFMENYVVTIDWPQSTIYLDPVTDDPRPDVPAAATLGWDGKRINVGSIVEGSDASEAGLTLQQPIASVDGEDVSTATRDDFCELRLAEQPGDQHTITVDSGQTYQIGPVADFYDPLQSA